MKHDCKTCTAPNCRECEQCKKQELVLQLATKRFVAPGSKALILKQLQEEKAQR